MTHPMKQYPPRPAVTKEIVLEAATSVAEDIGYETNPKDIVTAFENCGHYRPDGYELAKFMDDNFGWQIDIRDVNKLDEMSEKVNQLWNEECKKWFSENNIQPPFEIGTELKQGTITGIYHYEPGVYKVQDESRKGSNHLLLIKFEDAELPA